MKSSLLSCVLCIFVSLLKASESSEEVVGVFPELIPKFPAAALKQIPKLKKSIDQFKKRNSHNPHKMHHYLSAYAEDMFAGPLSNIGSTTKCAQELGKLVSIRQELFGDVDEAFIKLAQDSALRHRNIECAKEIYEIYLNNLAGRTEAFETRKRMRGRWDRDMDAAKMFVEEFRTRQDSFTDIIKELLDVPSGLEEVLMYCARQLQTRIISINNAINRVSKFKFEDIRKNQIYAQLVIGLYQKKILINYTMNRILKIKQMPTEGQRRNEMGKLACGLVWSRFTRKIPDDWLALLKAWEPLSPEWFFAHQKLDRIFLTLQVVPEVGSVVQQQVFLGGIILSRVIRALRSECSEPVKSYLPWLIYDHQSDGEMGGVHSMKRCISSKLEYVNEMSSKGKLTSNIMKLLLSHSIPNAVRTCAKEIKAEYCLDLTPQEITNLTSEKREDISFDFWLDDAEVEPKKNTTRKRRRNKKTRSASVVNGTNPSSKTTSNEASELSNTEEESHPSDSTGSGANKEHLAECKEDIENEEEAACKDKLVDDDSDKENKNIDVPQPRVNLASLVAKKYTFSVEYDAKAAENEMMEYDDSIEKFKELKRMQKYTYDSLKDTDKSMTVVESPSQYDVTSHRVVFFSTDDFCTLSPDINELFEQNMYLDTANTAMADPTIKLQWIFDQSVIIGKNEYLFLCQVFNLVRGSNFLNFDNFLATVRKLTKSANKLRASTTVFRFNHAFNVDGQVCLPPIGGVHREHESSGFNHKQVKKFLMHGGAHPGFFKVVQSKYIEIGTIIDPQ